MEAIFDETGSGGLDLALWDLAAQSLGKPVREIFGKTDGKLPGWRCVTDRALVRRRCGLRLRARDAEEALAMARCLQPLPLEFWESPLDPADLDGYRALREQAAVPIAVGPGLSSSALLRDFVQTRLVDIVLPDIALCGLTGLRRLAYPGWVFGVRVAPLCTAGSEALAREAAACFPARDQRYCDAARIHRRGTRSGTHLRAENHRGRLAMQMKPVLCGAGPRPAAASQAAQPEAGRVPAAARGAAPLECTVAQASACAGLPGDRPCA